jgi:hypothetical protein
VRAAEFHMELAALESSPASENDKNTQIRAISIERDR